MRTTQKIIFGTELPRGHGHKGKLSTKMSALYDDLTGRQPRKRKSKTSAQMPCFVDSSRFDSNKQASESAAANDLSGRDRPRRLRQAHHRASSPPAPPSNHGEPGHLRQRLLVLFPLPLSRAETPPSPSISHRSARTVFSCKRVSAYSAMPATSSSWRCGFMPSVR